MDKVSCHICGKKFSTNAILEMHIKSHDKKDESSSIIADFAALAVGRTRDKSQENEAKRALDQVTRVRVECLYG